MRELGSKGQLASSASVTSGSLNPYLIITLWHSSLSRLAEGGSVWQPHGMKSLALLPQELNFLWVFVLGEELRHFSNISVKIDSLVD